MTDYIQHVELGEPSSYVWRDVGRVVYTVVKLVSRRGDTTFTWCDILNLN